MFDACRERKQPLYAHIHMTALTHNHFNDAGYIDQYVEDFFQKFFVSKYDSNTIIFFYADHSIRYGPSLRTKIAYYESRLPAFQIYVPDNLQLLNLNGELLDSHQIKNILRDNSRKLTSHLDIHATMMHVLNKIPTRDQKYGQSLFIPVDESRTCKDAGIAEEYCACQPWEISDEKEHSERLVGEIMKYINGILSYYQEVCLPLTLDKIISLRIRSDYKNHRKHTDRLFSIDFGTKPNNATFRATIRENGTVIHLPPKIERLDDYHNQSECVARNMVEQYCYCRYLLSKNIWNK